MVLEDTEGIQSRRDLFDHLEDRMLNTYRRVLDGGPDDRESRYPRSFLFEYDWSPGELGQEEVLYLGQALSLPASQRFPHDCPAKVEGTGEEGFYRVTWQRTERPSVHLYLDTITDPARRFWLGYSVSSAPDTDWFLERLSRTQTDFDRVWLWPGLLRRVQQLGEFWGVGTDYDYRRLEPKQGQVDSRQFLKVQLRGGQAAQVLESLAKLEPNLNAFGRVILRYWPDRDGRPDLFAHEDIKYNGRMTTKGTSFDSHQRLLCIVRDVYSKQVSRIEQMYTARSHSQAGRMEMEGEPLVFDLQNAPIQDLDGFCEFVFGGGLPFRLWGIPEKTRAGQDGRLVYAVDLHTASRLFFEVYSDVIYFYLLPAACGNTAARFYTNLQHTLGASARWEHSEDDADI